MDAIEKRARELLAVEYERFDLPSTAAGARAGAYDLNPSMRAVVAALTPPEGYVLVPVEPTDDEVRVANEAQQEFFEVNTMSMFFSSGHYNEESIRQSLRAVRTARPEAPNVND